ncbi:PEP/pyruvate-binding domain-containing protein [Streptomyces sp. NBC_01217]|uniref:PEP/pyruvate-binding domain-containing protein n=1 Tax=Streptomyces sp. NBC_01217 TaxID=2903779 RepID=UPI002E1548E5|nr:PEP-utilizing enzyme [Streptomyces sp. NBC_01217]
MDGHGDGLRHYRPLEHCEGPLGGKAERLRTLLRAALPVPKAFVLSHETLDALDPGEFLAETRNLLLTGFPRGSAVVVRSSATGEDGPLAAAPGVYDSYLNRRTPREVVEAVRRVRKGLHAADAEAYRRLRRDTRQPEMNVVVQRMAACATSGVLYTRDPLSDEPAMRVESSEGLGTPVVAGLGCDHSWVIPRPGQHAAWGPEGWEMPEEGTLSDLLTCLASTVEQLFHRPQDVEWGLENGALRVFQSRDIVGFPAPLPPPHLRPAPHPGGVPVSPLSRGYAVGSVAAAGKHAIGPGEIVVLDSMPTAAELESLRNVGGLLLRRGNALSHSAALCRELGIPMALLPEAWTEQRGEMLLDAVTGRLTRLCELPAHDQGLAVRAAKRRSGDAAPGPSALDRAATLTVPVLAVVDRGGRGVGRNGHRDSGTGLEPGGRYGAGGAVAREADE